MNSIVLAGNGNDHTERVSSDIKTAVGPGRQKTLSELFISVLGASTIAYVGLS